MTVTREELAAFADGELDPRRSAEVEKAIAADRALAREVEMHRSLRDRLADHYAPIIDAPVPKRLTTLLQDRNNVVDLSERWGSKGRQRSVPRWTWIAGPALAASLVLALLVPRGSMSGNYADRQLAAILDNQLVATQPADASTRVLLSFRDDAGAYCRAYQSATEGGIACKDAQGWHIHIHETVTGSPSNSGEYRQASSPLDQIMAKVQEMADGPALDAEQEREALRLRWN